MTYSVHDAVLYWGERELGPASDIYVDKGQDWAGLAKETEGFQVKALPVGDYVFVSKGGHVVGIEEKKSNDLTSSIASRRLQRQLRHLEKAVEIPILGLRCTFWMDGLTSWYAFDPAYGSEEKFFIELFKWDLRGLTLFLPSAAEGVLVALQLLRRTIQPGAHLLSIVAGTDQDKHKPSTSSFAGVMMRLVDKLGPVAAAKLEAYFKGNVMDALSAQPEQWAEAGAHKGIVANFSRIRSIGQ